MKTLRLGESVALLLGTALAGAAAARIVTSFLEGRAADPTAGTVLMIGLAALVWPSVEVLKTPFGEVTKAKQEIQKAVVEAKRDIDRTIEECAEVELSNQPRLSRTRPDDPSALAAIVRQENSLPSPTVSDDPQKGRFGGAPEQNGRRLSATVDPEGQGWYAIRVRVESTDPERPLKGPVRLYLHDTFDPDTTVLTPRRGVARARIGAYGSFTIGAICADGTKLELDLADERLVRQPDGLFRST